MGHYTLRHLNNLIPRTNLPVEVPCDKDWLRIERDFTQLPSDFKEFLNCYGSGNIVVSDVSTSYREMLVIYSPFTKHEYTDMVRCWEALRLGRQLRNGRKDREGWADDELQPKSVFPDEGGFLPVGHTGDGVSIYWKTGGQCDDWTIASIDELEPLESNVGWIDYIVMSIKGEIRSDLFPQDVIRDIVRGGVEVRFESRKT